MNNEKLTKVRGWRKVAVVGGSLAVLAVGAAGTTQAFADQGSEGGTGQAVLEQTGSDLLTSSTPSEGRAKRDGDTSAVLDSTGSDALTPTADTSRTKAKAKAGASKKAATGSPVTALEAMQAGLAAVAPDLTVSGLIGINHYGGEDGDPYAKGGLNVSNGAGQAHTSFIEVSYGPAGKGAAASFQGSCEGQVACEFTDLPDGSQLVTYDVPFGGKSGGTNLGAARLVGGNVIGLWVRVPVNSSGKALSPTTTITREQLAEVLSQPAWANLVPAGQ